MLKVQKPEDASLPKSSSHRTLSYSQVRKGHKEFKSMQKLNSAGVKRSPFSIKFQKAFRSALISRSAYLGRTLTRQEWVQLKKSVHKSVSRSGTDKLSRKLNQIQRQLNQVTNLLVKTSLPQDAVDVLAGQLHLLRSQLVHAIQEKDSVSETCPHFVKRKLLRLPDTKQVLYYRLNGSRSLIPFQLDGKEIQLCCDACLSRREDFIFSISGSVPTITETSYTEVDFSDKPLSSCRLNTVPLFSIQSVWTTVVSNFLRSRY